MRIKPSRVRVTQPIFAALAIFLGSFLVASFASHSFMAVYDSSADTPVYWTPSPALSFAIVDPDDNTTLSTINLDASPGNVATKTVNLLASTSHETGFTLSFSDEDEDTALYRDGDSSSAYKIPSLSSSVSESTFPANTWGYSFDTDPTLTPIPTLPQGSVLVTEALAGDYTYPFTIAVKVDHSLPAGSYSDTVVFTMIGNPLPATFSGITYMHEMTDAICQAETTPLASATTLTTMHQEDVNLVPEATLIDIRGKDGTGTLENPVTNPSDPNYQTYVVRKLADGNCWMVQNLNLDLSTSVTLDNTTTDLGYHGSGNTTFTPQYNTQTAAGTTWTQTGSEGARSFEPGEEVYFADGVGSGTLDGSTNNYSSYETTGYPWYHVGNYYNWYAATAGTGTASAAANFVATDSICPKGWRLPDNEGSKSFYNLVYNTYGLVDNDTAASSAILSSPLNFVRSGLFYYIGNRQGGRGSSGGWWSTTAQSTTSTYNLDAVYPNRIIPQSPHVRGYGLSVRCVHDSPDLYSISTMQEMTPTICAATTTPLASATSTSTVRSTSTGLVPERTLVDIRGKDGSGTVANPVDDPTDPNYQTYLVRKLADGNCWMVQNLNMTLSTTITLDETTTDLTSGRTFTPERNTQQGGTGTWTQTGTEGARSYEPGENIYFAGGIGTGTLDATTTYNYSGYLTSGQPYWHIGNYYNWYAATAGTGLATMEFDNATGSICPQGWKLPDNDGEESFYNLILTTYGLSDNNSTYATKLLQTPLNFVRSGFYSHSEGRQWARGYDGRWWSATTQAATIAYYLFTNPSRVIPQGTTREGYGFSIRCLAR